VFSLREERNFFNNISTNFVIHSRSMVQAVWRGPLTTEVRVWFQISPRQVSTRQSGTWTGSLPSTSTPFPPPTVNIIPPMLHTRLHLHSVLTSMKNGQSLTAFQKKQCSSEMGENLIERYIHFFRKSTLSRIKI